MGLCNELCSCIWPDRHPADWPVIVYPFCVAKNFSIGHYMHAFLPRCHVPGMLIGATDFYHFIPPSVTLTLAGGSQGQLKAKAVGFIFSYTFQLNGMKWCWNNSSSISRYSFWMSFCVMMGNDCCLIDCIKKKLTLACIQAFLSRFGSNMVWW